MTFKQLQDATLSDRFGDRAMAKNAINLRLGELLALEDWAFLKATATVTLNAAIVALPSSAEIVTALLLNDDGSEVTFMSLKDFESNYLAATDNGRPEAFTVLGPNLLIGPTPDSAYAATLIHRVDATDLSADGDVPVTPSWSHPGLVAGAQAFLAQLENDATYAPLEQRHQQVIDAMRRRYLTTGRGKSKQAPRDPLGLYR